MVNGTDTGKAKELGPFMKPTTPVPEGHGHAEPESRLSLLYACAPSLGPAGSLGPGGKS